LDSVPADLIDALMAADEAEASVMEQMRQQAAKR
jgi:hypothetical protein